MRRTHCVARTIGWGLLMAGGVLASEVRAAEPASQRFVAPASDVIDCAQSPFGKAAPMIRDLERYTS